MDPAAAPADPRSAASWVKEQARQLGFDDVGIARADTAPDAEHFRRALQEGRLDGLPYLHERVEERCDPRVLLPGARSVVVVMMGYADPRPEAPAGTLKVARYAARRDYHNPITSKLRSLRSRMNHRFPGSDGYVSVDAGAVMERAWAQQAGVGWIGKSAMLLSRRLGTYTLLGALVTTVELEADAPGTDMCGTCTACIDGCPTGAITAPRQVDARRCITFHTVENPADEPLPGAPPLHGWVFGCDVCMEVCPYQKRGVANPALAPRPSLANLAFPPGDEEPLTGTPLARAGWTRLHRNARAQRGGP